MKFSKIAHLGLLNQYSKESFMRMLPDYEFTVLSRDVNSETIRCCGEQTVLVITYDLAGNFKQIVREEWLDQGIHFHHKRRE